MTSRFKNKVKPNKSEGVAMQTVQLISHIDQDGLLHIPVPNAEIWKDTDVEVLLVLQPIAKSQPSNHSSIVDLLATPEAEAVDFEPPRLSGSLYKAADLS